MKLNLFITTFLTVFVASLIAQFATMALGLFLVVNPILEKRTIGLSEELVNHIQRGTPSRVFTQVSNQTLNNQYSESLLPFNKILSQQLTTQLPETQIKIYKSYQSDYYLIRFQRASHSQLYQFHHSEIGTQPLLTLSIFALIILFSSLVLAWLMANAQRKAHRKTMSLVNQIETGNEIKPSKPARILEMQQVEECIQTLSKKLNQSEMEKRLILAGISHDIRTPITRLYLSHAVYGNHCSEEFNNQFETELAEVENLVDLFVSNAQGLEAKTPETLIDLNQWLKTLVHQYPKQASRIDYKTLVSDALLEIEEIALKRVIQNLIDNAIKYSNQSIEVRLDADRQHQTENYLITVSDFGNGLASTQQETVKAFKQHDNQSEGYGLGLHLVQYLCSQHRWQLSFTENQPTGLNVTIKLPVNKMLLSNEL